MLELVRLALRTTTNLFDQEIALLIADCLRELGDLGIVPEGTEDSEDPQIRFCVIAYCKWKYGENDQADRWERIYKDKVTRLMSTSGYGLKEDRHG